MKTECDYCGCTPDIGYLMPNGEFVCATYECCYEYCKSNAQSWFLGQEKGDNNDK